MKKLTSYLKKLEKRRIISKKPHPSVPFILAIIILILGTYSQYLGLNPTLTTLIYTFAIFTLIFAIIHLIVHVILTRK